MKGINEIQHLVADVTEAVNLAFAQGRESGMKEQGLLNHKLSDPKEMLKQFLAYTRKFKPVIYDDKPAFRDGDVLWTEESVISNFLLSSGYNDPD